MIINNLNSHKQSIYLNLIFLFIPVSFALGNLIINLNILLFIFLSLFLYGKKIFIRKYSILDKLIILLFFYLLFVGVYNNFISYYIENITNDISIFFKSILFIRYLILYFVLRFLIENELVDLKLFFFSSFLCCLFLCFDIFYQYIFGNDLFGYEAYNNKYSGFFGDEQIAGGYIQRFSFFSFFIFPFLTKFKGKFIRGAIISILFIIFFTAIIISGNRMPLILFIFMFLFILAFEKEVRKYLISFIIVSVISFLTIINSNKIIALHFYSFYNQIQILAQAPFVNISEKRSVKGSYYNTFATFKNTWLINKYTGGGIKSFRINCPKVHENCGTHPHNYYLEILTDLGIVGFFILSSIFLIVAYMSFFKIYFLNIKLKSKFILTPFLVLYLIEIFPIKSSGSLFSTTNATFIFLLIAIVTALSIKKIN